jgi:hypothetical protein
VLELGHEDHDDPLDELEKLSQDGGHNSGEKSDDSEDPPYTPPTLCTQNNDFKRETRGATRKDVEPAENVNEHDLVTVNMVNEEAPDRQNGAADSQQGHEKIKTETSDQGYDSNNSENENHKRAHQNGPSVNGECSYSNDDENCMSDDSIKIKKEHIDPEYEPLSSTDECDDIFLPGSPNIDANAFMLHNPLTFPLLRRTLNASPCSTAAAANLNSVSQRSVPSPGFLPMVVCPTAVPKINELHPVPPLVRGMPPQQLHSPQLHSPQLHSPQLQYQVNEQVMCPSVQQRPQLFHATRFDEQNPNIVHKIPQTLHEAQAQVGFLLSYIQTRENKFSDLERHFSDVSNEFRKLSHSFKQFQTERAAFLDFMNPSAHGT